MALFKYLRPVSSDSSIQDSFVTPYMSVVGQNKFGFLVHPISTFSGGELQLTETPHGKPSSAAQCTDKKKKKKKCRSTPLNHGEACLMAYHEKVREKLLNSWKSLVDLGKALKYFPTPVPMSLPDTSTMNPLGDKTDASLEDQQHVSSTDGSCTLQAACSSPGHENSVDLVDMCNQALVNPDIPDCKLLVLVGCHELDHMCGRIVHNFADHHVIMKHSKSNFYIPENSTFLLSDITQLHLLVDHVQSSRDLKYDCIVIDPPWENRSAIRSHKYSWLSENDLLQIPLPELCNEDCLVIIWVTNKVKFSDFVQNELFPQWSVKLAGEWHWIKVTTSGEFVFDLDSPHKKPYELLLLGKYHDKAVLQYQKPSPDDFACAPKRLKLSSVVRERSTKDIPHNQVIICVPSRSHSQKPFLGNVLKSYLPDHPKCLEMFARNLQPGWTSWGNEVLKFQIMDM